MTCPVCGVGLPEAAHALVAASGAQAAVVCPQASRCTALVPRGAADEMAPPEPLVDREALAREVGTWYPSRTLEMLEAARAKLLAENAEQPRPEPRRREAPRAQAVYCTACANVGTIRRQVQRPGYVVWERKPCPDCGGRRG